MANNPIVSTAPFGPVYKRKIHVFRQSNEIDKINGKWVYVWSSNAYKTCREAINAAQTAHPNVKFKASFAKD